MPWLRVDAQACVWLDVHVVPNASQTRADGEHDGALRLRLNAPPIEGRANQALIRWLAQALDLTRAEIELVRGESARRKQLRLQPDAAARARWTALLGAGSG